MGNFFPPATVIVARNTIAVVFLLQPIAAGEVFTWVSDQNYEPSWAGLYNHIWRSDMTPITAFVLGLLLGIGLTNIVGILLIGMAYVSAHADGALPE